MSPRLPLLPMAAVACLLALAACGGGGGPSFGGGISGTGKPTVTVGTITATDTLTVAGTTFATSAASVTLDGFVGTTGDLRVGMTATVTGVLDGVVIEAETIEVEEIVRGELEAKPDANTLVVQGQTLGVDATTVYGLGISPASPVGLTPGDLLRVYGYVLSSGLGFATRIEREDSLSSLRLTGFASGVDTVAQIFFIGTQAVDYATADTSDLPGGVPQNGQFLDVRALGTLGSLGELVATEIEIDNLEDREDNDRTEVEGFVTQVLTPTRFVVGGVTVDLTAATTYEGGTAADVAVGVRVEVEGDLAAGVITARKVEFESDVRLESDVATVSGSTITLVGLPGITIQVTALTEFDGDADVLGDIDPGSHVEIRGRATGASSVDAAQVKETGADTDIEIQGPVDATPPPSDPTLSILGLVIDTSAIDDGQFEGSDETVVGRTAFFAALAPGVLVRTSGRLSGGVPTWEEAQIESEDDD